MKIKNRNFMASVGDASTGIAGPDALIADIDNIIEVLSNLDDENIKSLSANKVNTSDKETLTESLNKLTNKIYEIIGTNTLDSEVEKSLKDLITHLKDKSNPHGVSTSILNVYTKDEILSYFGTSNNTMSYEVFEVEDISDGGFTYKDKEGEVHTSIIDTDGYYIFTLQGKSGYKIGSNAIEAVVNDALFRTEASGGLREIKDENSDGFSKKVGVSGLFIGCEVTFKYFSRINFYSKHAVSHINSSDELIHIGPNPKMDSNNIDTPIWFDTSN